MDEFEKAKALAAKLPECRDILIEIGRAYVEGLKDPHGVQQKLNRLLQDFKNKECPSLFSDYRTDSVDNCTKILMEIGDLYARGLEHSEQMKKAVEKYLTECSPSDRVLDRHYRPF